MQETKSQDKVIEVPLENKTVECQDSYPQRYHNFRSKERITNKLLNKIDQSQLDFKL